MPQAQTYQSEFTGLEMDARFAAVAQLTAALEALTAVVAQKYVKPASGIPSTDMDADVQAALAKANTAVQSLAAYYTKSEVDQLLAAINGMDYVDVASLPTASASTMGKIYLVGPDASGYYAYYYTSYDGSAYSWVGPLGTTEISLANYATKEDVTYETVKVLLDSDSPYYVSELSDAWIYTGKIRRNQYTSAYKIILFKLPAGNYELKTTTSATASIGIIFGTIASVSDLAVDSTVTGIMTGDGTEKSQVINFAQETLLVFQSRTSASDYFLYGRASKINAVSVKEKIADLEGELADLPSNVDFLKGVAYLTGKTVNYAAKVENTFINSTGAFVANTNFDTYVLKADEARKIVVKTGGNSGETCLGTAFFGSDVTPTSFISGVTLPEGTVISDVDIPAGTQYVTVSIRKAVLAAPEMYLTTGDLRPFVIGTDVTEIGNVAISSSGWTYSEDAERARTLYNCTLHLNPGDTIVCSGSTVVFAGGKLRDGSFVYSGSWVTYYPIRYEGDYVFVARFNPETAPADGNKKYITDNVRIYTENAEEIRAFFTSVNSPLNDWDKTIRSINHRGYNKMAPENTLPAFKLSKANGFDWVEVDIRLTADDEIVCIHDTSVDRTSNGTGNVADMTLAELKALDFGSWFSDTYTGVTIPTLGEFLRLCKCIGLCAYIELKYPLDATKAQQIVDTVRKYGMMGRVNYISYMANLQAMAAVDGETRLGFIGTPEQTDINNLLAIKESYGNDVFVDTASNTDEVIELCAENGVDVEYWVGNGAPWIVDTMKNGFWGLTSDDSVAGKYLYLSQREGAISH